jgi:hypothetical protein
MGLMCLAVGVAELQAEIPRPLEEVENVRRTIVYKSFAKRCE